MLSFLDPLSVAYCSREYTDLASIGSLPKYTCGQLYYYPSFNREKDGVKLTHEIVHNLTRTTGNAQPYLGSTALGMQNIISFAEDCFKPQASLKERLSWTKISREK